MKTRIPLILAALFTLTIACNLSAQSEQPASSPVPIIEPTGTPALQIEEVEATVFPTAVPTQAESAPAPSPTPGATAIARPAAVEGPESLDLSSPALYKTWMSEYTENYTDLISGQDKDNQPLEIGNRRYVRFQSQPAVAWFKTSQGPFEDAVTQMAMLEGMQYQLSPGGQCTQSAAGDPPQTVLSLLAGAFTGQAQRVEAGVMVNGMVADRYAISEANVVPGAEVELVETVKDGDSTYTNTTTITLMGSGNLYVAREGSFIIKLEMSKSKTAGEEDFFFKPGSEMTNTRLLELIPTAVDAAPIAKPAGCEASGADPGESSDSWPMLDDAVVISHEGSEVIYQTYYSMDEASEFYKSEMLKLGWTLSEETNLGSVIDLIFIKGGSEVNITLLQTGDTVTVTITQ